MSKAHLHFAFSSTRLEQRVVEETNSSYSSLTHDKSGMIFSRGWKNQGSKTGYQNFFGTWNYLSIPRRKNLYWDKNKARIRDSKILLWLFHPHFFLFFFISPLFSHHQSADFRHFISEINWRLEVNKIYDVMWAMRVCGSFLEKTVYCYSENSKAVLSQSTDGRWTDVAQRPWN